MTMPERGEQAATAEVSGVDIELAEVSKRYSGQKAAAVESLSLHIPAGEIVMFVGPSGCGKTTSLKMINRLIEPSSGRISIAGKDIRSQNADHLRRQVGYVIQGGSLFPHMTVAQNIGLVPGLLKWDKKRIDERVEELLDLVGMDPGEFRDRFPRQLSGGQQQRVGVARALAADPPVLLMDEPFGAVDPITRGNLQDELLSLQSELHKTIVFVTHDFDEAVKLGDRIAVLGPQSSILQFDTPEAILAAPADDTVAGFVGAGASLKQLTLLRVRDIELDEVETATLDEQPSVVRDRLVARNRKYALVLDSRRRPKRWVHLRDLNDGALGGVGRPVNDQVTKQSTVQDALEAILTEGGSVPVVGTRGEFLGAVGIDTVMDTVRKLREEHENG